MIVGIGTDIVEIIRFKKIIEKFQHKFAQRILSEIEYTIWIKNKCNHRYLAKRFAAKEATSKALGCGIGKVAFKDIEITNLNSGSPQLTLHNCAAELQNNLKINKLHLSISDERSHAVAMVILENV